MKIELYHFLYFSQFLEGVNMKDHCLIGEGAMKNAIRKMVEINIRYFRADTIIY